MVKKKDEVCLWFKNSEPHRRLELLCGLLNMCLPMELRFIGTVVEDLGKRDFHDLRDAEHKANSTQEIKRLSDLLEERTRSNLIVYVALLTSRNHTCSTLLYQILAQAHPLDTTTPTTTNATLDANYVKEMLLIYTMVLHHPAFTFEQKRVIADLHAQASKLEARLSPPPPPPNHSTQSELLSPVSQSCNSLQEGCDSGLSVGTEPEGDGLLEGCGLPTPPSHLHHYHHHTPGVGGLSAAQSPESGGNQDACSSGSGESGDLYNEGGTVSTTYIYNSIYEQQSLVALTMASSYPCNHPNNFHYYPYPPILGTVPRCVPSGKVSHSDGSSSEEGSANLIPSKGPPVSNSPLSSPQSSPYVSPLQSLSPSRASSPLSHSATTTTATTTTTLASLPSTVVASTVCAATGSCSHSGPVQKQSGGLSHNTAAVHGSVTQTGSLTVTCTSGQPHRKPPSSGSRSQRHTDRSGSRTRLSTVSGENELVTGNQSSQNSPSSGRIMNPPSHSINNNNNHLKNRWAGNSTGVLRTSTSTSSSTPPAASIKSNIRQSPCPTSGNTTTCRILTTATVTASSPGCKTTSVSSHAVSGSFSTSISSSATNTTRNTSPPIVHAGNQDKSTLNTSTNSGIRPTLSTGNSCSTLPSSMHKSAHNNNNCLNRELRVKLNKHYQQLAQYPLDKLKKMSDRDLMEMRLNKDEVGRLRNLLANLESHTHHLHNGYTNSSITLHSRSLPHSQNTITVTTSHTPSTIHPRSSAHSPTITTTTTTSYSPSHSPRTMCHVSSHSPINTTTTCHASSSPPVNTSGHTSPSPHIATPTSNTQHASSNSKAGSSEVNSGSQKSVSNTQNIHNSASSTSSNSKNTPGNPNIQSSKNNTSISTGSSPSAQTTTPSSVTIAVTVSNNISTSTTTLTNSTASVVTTVGDTVVTASTVNSPITAQVTHCLAATASPTPKNASVSMQQPKSVQCVTVTVQATSSTCSSSTTSLSPCSALTPHVSQFSVPPPPIPNKLPPQSTATANFNQHQLPTQPPPGQHRTPPPPLCVPPRTPSQEPCSISTTASITGYYTNNGGVGVKNNPSGVNGSVSSAASSQLSIASYTAPINAPQPSSAGNVALPIYTSAGSMPVYTTSGNIGVPPPTSGGLIPMAGPGSHYHPAYLYHSFLGPGGAPTYVPPGTYAAHHAHRSFYMSHSLAPVSHVSKLKATQHLGTTGHSGSRGGSSSSSSSCSSGSTRGFSKGNHKGHNHVKSCTRSSDSSPSSSQYSSPPQTPSPDHTPDLSTEKRGKTPGDVIDIPETGETLGITGLGQSEDGTPPPFPPHPNPMLLPQTTIPRPRMMPYSHLGYIGLPHGGMLRYPGITLPTQAPLIAPRNSLPISSDKSSRETTPPVQGTVPVVQQDLQCCVRSVPDGSTVPNSLAGNSHGRNGGSPHGPASHSDGPPLPAAHTPVLSGASHPAAQVPPGNTSTGAPHNSVQYNAPGYPVIMNAPPMFPQFQGFVPAHSSPLSNGFVSSPLAHNFPFSPVGNAEYMYAGQYPPLLGGSSQGGGGNGCGTPGGLGTPSTPGQGLSYTHYSPVLPHTATPTPSAGAKKSCYNCGHVGHNGAECKEANIEEMCNIKTARS